MECLGSCGTAPMAIVTDQKSGEIRYFENLDSAEDVGRVIELLKAGKGFAELARWTPQADPRERGRGGHTLSARAAWSRAT